MVELIKARKTADPLEPPDDFDHLQFHQKPSPTPPNASPSPSADPKEPPAPKPCITEPDHSKPKTDDNGFFAFDFFEAWWVKIPVCPKEKNGTYKAVIPPGAKRHSIDRSPRKKMLLRQSRTSLSAGILVRLPPREVQNGKKSTPSLFNFSWISSMSMRRRKADTVFQMLPLQPAFFASQCRDITFSERATVGPAFVNTGSPGAMVYEQCHGILTSV